VKGRGQERELLGGGVRLRFLHTGTLLGYLFRRRQVNRLFSKRHRSRSYAFQSLIGHPNKLLHIIDALSRNLGRRVR
jgi:hypothetical protein